MSINQLSALIPQDKHETEKAQSLIALGYPAVIPVLPNILECLQDPNWPIAQVFQPFLISIGAPLAPYIRKVLENDDYGWHYNLLLRVVYYSPPLARELVPELRRLATAATKAERLEELDIIAQETLAELGEEYILPS